MVECRLSTEADLRNGGATGGHWPEAEWLLSGAQGGKADDPSMFGFGRFRPFSEIGVIRPDVGS